jgi:excisionase family DNA binding protein
MVDNIQNTPNKKKTYTIEEIAIQLSISKKSAYKLVHEQNFHSVRIGRSIRIAKESFDNWLNKIS